MKTRLRWKMAEREKGLRAIGAGPRGHYLHDGKITYVTINALGGDWREPLRGFYWYGTLDGNYVNTCDNPIPLDECKKKALAWVKEILAKRKVKYSTPGPWLVLARHKHFHSRRIWGEGGFIASVGGSDDTEETQDANAAIISAAPELYAALETLVLELDCGVSEDDFPTEVYEAARAAIKKARRIA